MARNFFRNPITRQIAADQEGGSGTQRRSDGNQHGAEPDTEERASAERERGTGHKEHGGDDVEQNEDHGAPRAETFQAGECVAQERADIESEQREHDGGGDRGQE